MASAQSSVRKWNLKKICLPSQFCRRMGVRIGNQLVRIQSRYPPVHRRIRRKSGLKSMYIGCHILKAFLYRIKPGKCAEHGKMRCPDMSRHIYALRYRFKHNFQQIPAIQTQNRLPSEWIFPISSRRRASLSASSRPGSRSGCEPSSLFRSFYK